MSKKNKKAWSKQTADSTENREAILNVLMDGKWHQYKTLAKEAHLSNPTLSKHLKELKKMLEKEEDEKDSRIIYYKLKISYLLYRANLKIADELWQRFGKTLLTTKNPLLAMKEINTFNNVMTMAILKIVKEIRGTEEEDEKTIKFLIEQKRITSDSLTYSLIMESKKILDEVDIDQLLKDAAAEVKPEGE